MIKSMTAYGRGEVQQGDIVFVAEIRSVNNRFRDIILRVPKSYQILDKDLRAIISSRIRRGRVEVSIQMENNGDESPYDLELNVPLVNSYLKIFDQLGEQFGLDKKIKLESLCQMRDVILVKPEPVDIEKVKPGFQEVLMQALDSLDLMKIKEGEAIEADFVKRLELLEGYINEVEERAPDLVEEYRSRLQNNVEHMLKDVAVDENRMAQEVAFFAERSDITEEVVRFRSHLNQFREYLSLDDAIGRRLDFLLQEMNREVNTLGSKASDTHISRVVVEMKAELEKLREQVQNVE
ncbi:MAG: YicC family protein [Deltaproteobacteria bacterium]|nr:YicC family protein [Deltaproteobacteria bacterium]MBW1737042.1 YicC family protein [Deltaproteobacteria bacterium]MBW1909609.1 YicC family protein [Deltaproteobacteria bacterium]MBW2033606.1 YicC family protein [Deltaproteobacteria bacterium]MBW2114232.1 YicC family protein [Deltaproteobacteria bacterium]